MSAQVSLQSKLDELKRTITEQAPEEVMAVIRESMELLASSGIINKAKKIGDLAPDFALKNIHDKQVSLKDATAKGPVILTFYRGGWCQFCQLQLKALQETLSEFEQLGASLIAVSPQTLSKSQETAEELGLTFDLLSDPGNKVAHEFGIVFTVRDAQRQIDTKMGINLPETNDDDSFELPVPATYIIDHDRIIRYSFFDTDYTVRMEPVSILDQIMRIVS